MVNVKALRRKGLFTVAVMVMAAALISCSTRKNTAATRQYQAFITRYNIYYNGDTHYKETLQEMEDKYEDDYTRLVLMHPVEAKADEKAPQPQGDFTRSKPSSCVQSRNAPR